jgi:hypothetical protein
VSLARKQERMRRETVGATALAIVKFLREEAAKPKPMSLKEVADLLEWRILGPVGGTNEQKEAG